jgi:glycosyltransferase involved in cell wall biosynthesis
VKVAFVTPRYGTEVIGGAETAARLLAERLVAECGWPVEVFTSCALDHLTWENTEPVGTSVVGGVTVHRFPAASRRRLDYFELDGRIRVAPESASLDISRRWVALNGPMCPGLVDAVAVTDADVLAATPYLFASTVDAIAVSTVPTVLHPAAHDEPALYLAAFRRSVADLDGLVYYTRAERELVEHVFGHAGRPQIVLGLGVDGPDGSGKPGGEQLGLGERPYLCYVGRVDEHKGCLMLADYFREYKARRPSELALAFLGPVSDKAPDHPDIVVTGVVPEAMKWDVLAGSLAMVHPSAYESFSLAVLEGWVAGIPVMVNAACAATMEHCQRSGGGMWFDSYRAFEVALDRLVGDAVLRRRLSAAGQAYVGRHYRWPAVVERYSRFLGEVVGRGARPRLQTKRLQLVGSGAEYVRGG